MKQITAYSFSELSPQARKKALDQIETDVLYDHDDLLQEMTRELEEMGLMDVDIQYSGFWSQGDGLSFTGHVAFPETFCKQADVPCLSGIEIGFVRHSTRYSHENTCTTRIDFIQAPESREQQEQVNLLAESLEIWRIDQCRSMYKRLEQEYEACTSEKAMIEFIEANDYHFLEDGRLV